MCLEDCVAKVLGISEVMGSFGISCAYSSGQ